MRPFPLRFTSQRIKVVHMPSRVRVEGISARGALIGLPLALFDEHDIGGSWLGGRIEKLNRGRPKLAQ
jgi:hypothetical protein